ncbi:eukaryotic translation initiation factor 3 subunit I-like isoform X1 [Varroa jacobsoni]|uniref:Eukaryotic translation initiation factor 3 subunit I n=2 Tax=Varroa destructor TaxID=109461 RepID=A0A7M7JHN1_VARDE|nr:eukaryotic translation initiation factor 3 subunit I-like isoform X1 [Varroa destructor]XP_022702316.1 eukaryotic translation initiation factor 3 subunit I-like isoform X1 [Varroa jacobsoni]
MRPLMLQGHERAVTQIKYNREGDLLFTAAKDSKPNIFYSLNGERLGNLIGHNGAVWCIDVNWDSTRVITAGAEGTVRLWDLETGKCTSTHQTTTAARTCAFSYSGRYAMYSTDNTMGKDCEMTIIDFNDPAQVEGQGDMLRVSVCPASVHAKVTAALWWNLDDGILTGHEDGSVCIWDFRQGLKRMQRERTHSGIINDMQYNKDCTMVITASKDHSAKVLDSDSLTELKKFQTERPVNSAAISPIRYHVLLGGGQEARDVTTTSAKQGKFDARFYHLIFEEEFGRVKDHFGPINSVAFHPDGKSYSSGGEDGYVRVHHFDPSYFELQFEGE